MEILMFHIALSNWKKTIYRVDTLPGFNVRVIQLELHNKFVAIANCIC